MAFCPKCGKDVGVSAFCPACGAPSNSTSVAGAAAATAMAPAPARKKSRRGLLVVGLLAVIIAIIGYITSIGSQINESKKPTVITFPCASEAGTFMELMREGDKATYNSMWKPGSKPVELFDVRKVDQKGGGNRIRQNGQPYSPARVFHEFEVESSTQGGLPIIKRWVVDLEPSSQNAFGKNCAVVGLASVQ